MSDFKFLKGNVETIILNALYNGDKYGYEIAKEIKEKTDNQYEIKQPTLYGYLKRLQSQGLIEFYWGEESFGGRRKYFRLTDDGKKTCEQYMSEWNFHKNILDSLVAKSEDDIPPFTPDKNAFLGSKSSLKRQKAKKQIPDSDQSQQLHEKLLQLAAQNSDEVKITDDTPSYEIDFNEESQGQFSFSDFSEEPIIIRREEKPVIDIFHQDFEQPEEPEKEEIIQTNTSEELPRIESEEKYLVSPDTAKYSEQRSEFLDSLILNQQHENNAPLSSETQKHPEESETEKQYKVILGKLLGDQIKDTDEKVKQISPKTVTVKEAEEINSDASLTELADKYAKEGYRIRFYNTATSQYRAVPMLIKNKINCITAWATLCLFYLLSLLMWIAGGSAVSFSIFAIGAIVFLLVPLYYTYVYVSKPNIRIKPNHDFKHSLVNKLIVFIFLAAVLLCIDLLLAKIDFGNIAELIYKFVLPCTFFAMLPASEIIYKYFLKSKKFYN